MILSLFAAILGLFLIAGFLIGLLTYPYYVHVKMICLLASKGENGKPESLFYWALYFALITVIGTFLVCSILGAIAGEIHAGIFLLLLPLGFGGLVLCQTAILKSAAERRQRAFALEAAAVTKTQVWLQDILVSVFVFGTVMTILFNLSGGARETVAIFAMLEFLWQGLAFVIAMNVSRFCRFESKAARAWFFMVCMAVAAVPVLIVIEILAWMAWRTAMAQSALEEANRERHLRLCGMTEMSGGGNDSQKK